MSTQYVCGKQPDTNWVISLLPSNATADWGAGTAIATVIERAGTPDNVGGRGAVLGTKGLLGCRLGVWVQLRGCEGLVGRVRGLGCAGLVKLGMGAVWGALRPHANSSLAAPGQLDSLALSLPCVPPERVQLPVRPGGEGRLLQQHQIRVSVVWERMPNARTPTNLITARRGCASLHGLWPIYPPGLPPKPPPLRQMDTTTGSHEAGALLLWCPAVLLPCVQLRLPGRVGRAVQGLLVAAGALHLAHDGLRLHRVHVPAEPGAVGERLGRLAWAAEPGAVGERLGRLAWAVGFSVLDGLRLSSSYARR